MHPHPRPEHSAPSSAAAAFHRALEAVDLSWSAKKLIGLAVDAGVGGVEDVCDHVAAQAAARRDWAERDGDTGRLAKWAVVARLMADDRAGFRAYVARRLEWLGLSRDEQQERLAANRKPPSTAQIRLLSRLGGDVHIEDAWQASRAIDKLLREQRA